MASKEVIEYIKQEMRAGHAPAQIKKALLDVGWSESEVESALSEVGVNENQQTNPQSASPAASTPSESSDSGIQSPQVGGAGASSASAQSTPQGMSTLDRNLATRSVSPSTAQSMQSNTPGSFASPELQSAGLGASRTDSASLNVPTGLPGAGSATTAPAGQEIAASSRLGSQSTGGTMADFTGTAQSTVPSSASPIAPATTTPALDLSGATSSPVAPKEKKKGKAGNGWYMFIGFLLGVLVTLLVLGIWVAFTA